ncbi:MAG: 2-dehydropantoate 2-reductase [Anaerolineales bacterium]|nr:2-dehydropantoate 2-reductase [Anaerolineales bacterium]
MRIVIIGAGAIGGYIGGSLAAAGRPVTFVARANTAAALRAHGLRLTPGPGEAALTVRPGVAASVAEALTTPADLLVLAVKAYATGPALAEIAAATTTRLPCLCLQNGVDAETEAARALGAANVLAGTVTTAVSAPEPGAVVVEKRRGVGVALGHRLSEPLLAALGAAGVRARGYAAAGPMTWSKLLTNLLGNATAAILDWPVAAILADPRLFALEAAAAREALAVMRALGYGVVDLPGTPVRLLAAAMRLPPGLARPLLRRGVAGGRGGKRPSLQIDLRSGKRQTEAEWLYGAVARHGAARGVPTPVNQGLNELMAGLSSGALDPAEFAGRPAALLARLGR